LLSQDDKLLYIWLSECVLDVGSIPTISTKSVLKM